MESVSDGLPRTYIIKKSHHFGYGFIAGGESPTMVKTVEPNGPSYKRLLPGDVIMAVNGIQVEAASREKIIKMIQLCHDQIEIKVRQPIYGGSLKNSSEFQPMLKRSNTMRPIKSKVMEIFEVVIKIFFEDGNTRVLDYNRNTTVGAILETLNSRISGNSEQIKRYFGLALTVGEQMPKRKLLHILDEEDSIIKIRQLPYAHKLRLLYRMVYPPADVYNLYTQDKIAFEYLYKQSCNDLSLDRFCPELDQEVAIKLSALHLLEYVHTNHPKAHGNSKDPKVYIRLVKKAPGIEHFLPSSITENMVDKKGKRNVGQYKKLKQKLTEQIKKNFEEFDFEPPKVKTTTNYSTTSFHELFLPEMQTSPSDCIKLLFLNYLSQFSCYGNSERPTRTSTSLTSEPSPSPISEPSPSPISEPSPMPRQQTLLKNIYLLPPLPPAYHLTRVLTDHDIEKLRVPPPPRITE